jgi:hypothetical protein
MSVAVQEKILGLLYDQWFKDYVLGASLEALVLQLDISDVEVYQALDILQTNGLAQKNKINWYVITVYGIDKFEEIFYLRRN